MRGATTSLQATLFVIAWTLCRSLELPSLLTKGSGSPACLSGSALNDGAIIIVPLKDLGFEEEPFCLNIFLFLLFLRDALLADWVFPQVTKQM